MAFSTKNLIDPWTAVAQILYYFSVAVAIVGDFHGTAIDK
jgi:hypothetical protein